MPSCRIWPCLGLLVGEHQLGVDRRVLLPVRVVDLLRREHRVHPERARLVRDDRHEPRADLLVLHQLPEQPDERHRRGHLLLARALADDLVDLVAGQHQRLGRDPARGHRAAERAGAAPACTGSPARPRPGGSTAAGTGSPRARASEIGMRWESRNSLRSSSVSFFIWWVALRPAKCAAQPVALDRLGQDDRRLAVVLRRGGVGRVDLAVVVPAALEVPDLVVGHRLDQRLRPRVAAEEVLADERAVVGLVGLVVAVGRGVHQVDQRAVAVGVQQRVPLPAPDHLDDVPAGAAEERLQLLDDLAVAADRAVEPLQVAVDDEGQVVQALAGGDVDQAARLRLVHLAVAEERPDVLVARCP